LDPVALARTLAARLATLASAAGWPMPELRVEPGRWLVANAGCTIYTVLGRKEAGGRTLVAVDGGMSDNLRPMLYDAVHAIARASAPPDSDAVRTVTVVGRHCESGDVLAHDVPIVGTLEPGDLLAVAATGAYTYAGASTANRFGRPAVVGVEEGRITPWLRREDAADMDRLEVSGATPTRRAETPQGVTIRPATPSDARGFLAHWGDVVMESRFLRTERVETTPTQVRKRFRRSWMSEEANILAVAADGRVVGHLGMSRERHPATRHVATLGMAVTAGDRRRGVGTALLAEGFRWARDHGVAKLLLSVYPENTPAIALYRRFGFEEEGRLARQSRTSSGVRDEILMAAWVEEAG
jgi:ribosomal protein S18 acetylase RimI-like enzyme